MSTATAAHPVPALPDLSARAVYDLRGLRAWRQYLGIAREELVRETDISQLFLYQAESGRKRMRGRLVTLVADALAIPAPILVAYGPADQEAREYALRALVVWAEKRLQRGAVHLTS
jgi:transcriptional regulator with XRE-family HTH domain